MTEPTKTLRDDMGEQAYRSFDVELNKMLAADTFVKHEEARKKAAEYGVIYLALQARKDRSHD